VAVVGTTGTGKTTVARLVPRFYDVDDGRVLLDGMDVRDVKIHDLRRSIGIVFEDTFLFSDTVRDNIAFADPQAPMETVRGAARLAGADEFIDDMPDGYETIVGEYGYTLSGGQRQRLAIARAVLADPRVLILDDATSSAGPALVGHGIDAGLRKNDAGALNLSASLYLFAAIAGLFFGRAVIRMVAKVGEAFLRDLRSRVFRHLMSLGMDFFEREKTGKLV